MEKYTNDPKVVQALKFLNGCQTRYSSFYCIDDGVCESSDKLLN